MSGVHPRFLHPDVDAGHWDRYYSPGSKPGTSGLRFSDSPCHDRRLSDALLDRGPARRDGPCSWHDDDGRNF